ncbi:MAG: hypothetical protein AB4372_29435 [Xenococcus sp. (in: cyanobacteria)]
MATLNIDNIPDELLTQIEKIATKNNCSIKEQAINLLKIAVISEIIVTENQTSKSITEILEEGRNRREKLPSNIQWLDSTALIREDRDR